MRYLSPASPDLMDWTAYYPAYVAPDLERSVMKDQSKPDLRPLKKDVTVADIGCGFGGLLVALAPKLPDELLIGKLFSGHGGQRAHVDGQYRHGDTDTSHGVRPGQNQSASESERWKRHLPEHCVPTCQQHEIPTELLQESAIGEDLSLLSGSALQSSETQSPYSILDVEFRIRFCDGAWRNCVYDYGRRGLV